MFLLMLRCGLRVEEVAKLALTDLDLRRSQMLVHGKGAKERIVYISDDTYLALVKYLETRKWVRVKKYFWLKKEHLRVNPYRFAGFKKRMEYYTHKAGINISCSRLRHTMATQLLDADADLVNIQDLLKNSRIKTTQRYSKVSILKVQSDYYKAMWIVMQRTSS